MGRLLEVDVSNAVVADVVILDHTELGLGSKSLDLLRGRLDVVTRTASREGRLDLAALGVAAKHGDGELGDVDAALAQPVVGVGGSPTVGLGGVGGDSGEATEAENHGVLHLEGEETERQRHRGGERRSERREAGGGIGRSRNEERMSADQRQDWNKSAVGPWEPFILIPSTVSPRTRWIVRVPAYGGVILIA